MHIQSRTKCNWLRERLEAKSAYKLSNEEKFVAYDRLAWVTLFENYLGSLKIGFVMINGKIKITEINRELKLLLTIWEKTQDSFVFFKK